MSLYVPVVQTLGTLALGSWVITVLLVGALLASGGRAWLRRTFAYRARHLIGWAWGVSLLATAGSLYLSEVAGLAPCQLCWYQRIAMYPLVLVLGVGLLRGDPGVWRFALPLPLVGVVISAYHVALQFNPSLDIVSCEAGVPCSARYLAVYGFISIPMMAGTAFLLIAVLLLAVRVAGKEA